MDGVPRPPLPRPGIDTTLKVSDFIDQQNGQWIEEEIRRTVDERDVSHILKTKLSLRLQDKHIWDLSKKGVYTSQSGYRFLTSLLDFQTIQSSLIPPIERSVWSNIWKLKTVPKIRHFFWRCLAGALAVYYETANKRFEC